VGVRHAVIGVKQKLLHGQCIRIGGHVTAPRCDWCEAKKSPSFFGPPLLELATLCFTIVSLGLCSHFFGQNLNLYEKKHVK